MLAIVHQTYPLDLIEVIIADDGSSDNQIIGQKIPAYFEIKYVGARRTKDSGMTVRNLGVSVSSHIAILFSWIVTSPLS